MHIDLHCHSTASDGKLTLSELCRRAEQLGVDVLSITDHDTMAAYRDFDGSASGRVKLIHGIEFSTQYRNIGIHVLGLNVKPDGEALKTGIAVQQQARAQRAERIAAKLEKLGVADSLSAVRGIASNECIGRLHFAEHLVAIGKVKNIGQAFRSFLGQGKSCYVKQTWMPMGEIIGWIRDAGGMAVLAHPAKYNLTRTKLSELLDAFVEAGGQGMEVISGQQQPDLTATLAQMCRAKKMFASCGSDFHRPDQPWSELGKFPDLPADCTPVWAGWNLDRN